MEMILGLFLFAGTSLEASWSKATGLEVTWDVVELDGDGASDLVLARGSDVWIRHDAAVSASRWTRMDLAPWSWFHTSRVRGGDVDGDGLEDVALSAPGANRVLVLFGQRDRSAAPRIREVQTPGGPSGMDMARMLDGDGSRLSILAMETPKPYVGRVGEAEAAGRDPLTAARFELTIDGHSLGSDETLDFASPPASANGGALVAWLHRQRAGAGAEGAPELSWHQPDATQATRRKWGDITLKRGYLTSDAIVPALSGVNARPAVIVSGPGLEHFSVVRAPAEFGGAIDVEEVASFPYRDLGWSAGDVAGRVGAGTGGRLWVTREDGRQVAVYRWSTSGRLELAETVEAPADMAFDRAVGLGDGGMATLMGPTSGNGTGGGPLRLGIYQAGENGMTLAFVTDLPEPTSGRTLARVLVLDRDPFQNGAARLVESFAAGDWVRSARVDAATVRVRLEVFRGGRLGLGASEERTLTASQPLPGTAFALANQWEPSSSLYFGAAPMAPGAASVSLQPAPGSYPGPVELTLAAGSRVQVVSRVGDGPWREGNGPFTVDRTAVVEFYGIDSEGRAGPRQSGRYVITSAQHKPSGALRGDADGDGLDDAWERLMFGGLGSGAGDDGDGDGFSNADEYTARTHPLDAASRPEGSEAAAPDLELGFNATGQPVLAWEGLAGVVHAVEISDDMREWVRSGVAVVFGDGVYRWQDPEPLEVTRFYRVIRLP